MKKIIEEYKKEIKSFLTNVRYIIPIIFVAILSYGFIITHGTIGVDDLCFDRYVSGTYILSAKRWGTWLLYNILNITEFSPFWLDFIVVTFMVIIAVILSAFFRKNLKDKINIWGYVIFSSIFISNPIISHFFVYQTTNLSIVISSLMVIISVILVMENYFGNKKKRIYIISSLLLTIAISMYESCAQTYIVLLFISIFIKLVNKEEKNLLKYFFTSISCLIVGIIGYLIIGKITLYVLQILELKEKNYASVNILWKNEKFWKLSNYSKIKYIEKILIVPLFTDMKNYYPTTLFFISCLIVLISELIKSYKTNKNNRLLVILGMILTNFILIVMQVKVLYRTQFSWILTTAFLALYIYQIFKNKKILKYIISIIFIFIIIIQTRNLNQTFYNDYLRYEKDKLLANQIAIDIIQNTTNSHKPLAYMRKKKNITTTNMDFKSIIDWGINAFDEHATEITKFINHFGYEFTTVSNEQYKKAKEEYELLDEENKNKNIIELEEYIIINLEKYE